MTVLRDIRDTHALALSHGRSIERDRRAGRKTPLDCARFGGPQADNRLRQFALSAPVHSRHSHDLTRHNLQESVADRNTALPVLNRKIVNTEQRRGRRGGDGSGRIAVTVYRSL